MKLLLQLSLFLLPVFAICQASKPAIASSPGSDSLITPSLSREWTANEFQEVFKSIIAKQNATAVETITIATHRNLFAKLTNIKNYWFLNSKYHTLNERFNYNLSLQGLIKTTFLHYYQNGKIVNGQLRYEAEVAAFFELLFGITKSQTELADEFRKANPNLTQIQLDGFKKMIQGITTMEGGMLLTLEKEYIYYSKASVCKLSSAFNAFYSFMYTRIDQDSKTEFDRRIANLVKTHPLPCVRTALQTKR